MASASRLDSLLRHAASLEGTERERAFDELVHLLIILVRARMSPKLRASRESVDVCQSVAKSFVEDWQAGRLAFDNEAALAGYLQTVVRNKLADLARRDTAARRGGGVSPLAIDEAHGVSEGAIVHGGAGASTIAEARELGDRLDAALTDEDRRLIDLRRRGLEWETIASMTGESAAALRKRWSRMQERVGRAIRPPSVG
jgi:DNA-directed RNA polymerase specialized sigma24 family protein